VRVLIIIAFALATVIGITYLASAHSFHYTIQLEGNAPSVPQTDIDSAAKAKITKLTGKDAFYGNAETQSEKNVIDTAHQARLASKSNESLIADLQLAIKDIINRFRGE